MIENRIPKDLKRYLQKYSLSMYNKIEKHINNFEGLH